MEGGGLPVWEEMNCAGYFPRGVVLLLDGFSQIYLGLILLFLARRKILEELLSVHPCSLILLEKPPVDFRVIGPAFTRFEMLKIRGGIVTLVVFKR